MEKRIKRTSSGNCPCYNCGRLQPGSKMHPYTVWYKGADEKRGHNAPVCSAECARAYADKIEN